MADQADTTDRLVEIVSSAITENAEELKAGTRSLNEWEVRILVSLYGALARSGPAILTTSTPELFGARAKILPEGAGWDAERWTSVLSDCRRAIRGRKPLTWSGCSVSLAWNNDVSARKRTFQEIAIERVTSGKTTLYAARRGDVETTSLSALFGAPAHRRVSTTRRDWGRHAAGAGRPERPEGREVSVHELQGSGWSATLRLRKVGARRLICSLEDVLVDSGEIAGYRWRVAIAGSEFHRSETSDPLLAIDIPDHAGDIAVGVRPLSSRRFVVTTLAPNAPR